MAWALTQFTGTDGNVNTRATAEMPNSANVQLEKNIITRFSGSG